MSVYFGVSALASMPVRPAGRTVRPGPGGPRSPSHSPPAPCSPSPRLARSYPVLVGLLALGAAANALGQLASNAGAGPARARPTAGAVVRGEAGRHPGSPRCWPGRRCPAIALTAGWRWAFVAAAGRLRWPRCRPYHRRRPDRRGSARRSAAAGPPRRWWWSGAAAAPRGGGRQRAGHLRGGLVGAPGLTPGPAGLVLTLGGAVCVAARIGVGWLGRPAGHRPRRADRRDAGGRGRRAGLLAVAGPVPLPWGWCSASGWAGPGPA